MKKWNNLSKKVQANFRPIYSEDESFGIYVDLDGGRQQNVGFILTGFGKRQFVMLESIICDVKKADLKVALSAVPDMQIGALSLSDNFLTLRHVIALETLDDEISAFSSYDTLVYAIIYLATKADEMQKLLKIKDDTY